MTALRKAAVSLPWIRLVAIIGVWWLAAAVIPSTAEARWQKSTQGPQPGDGDDPYAPMPAKAATALPPGSTQKTLAAQSTIATYSRLPLSVRIRIALWWVRI